MRPGEFWDLTLEELSALMEMHEARLKLENYRAGLAASAVYNLAGAKRSKPIQPLDFFEAKKPTTDEEILAKIRELELWQRLHSS